MTFTEAAAEVLRQVGRPLHYKEITDLAIEKNLLSHVGKSPEVTMGARLAALLKKSAKDNPLVRVKPGVFALREWDEDTIKSGMSDKSAAAEAVKGAGAAEAAAEGPTDKEREPEREVAAPPSDWEDEVESEQAPDDRMRAEIAAAGAELFGEEDDDDRPILGGDEPAAPSGAAEGGTGRRRRRRRRRRTNGEAAAPAGGGGLPSYTVTPAFGDARGASAAPAEALDMPGWEQRPLPIEPAAQPGPAISTPPEAAAREGAHAPAPAAGGQGLEDLAGRDLADAVAFWLNTFDRNGGPIGLRQLAENAQRRGRLSGDLQQAQAQIAAAIRADNLRRQANGQRMRFRFAGGKVALTDWLLGGELARLEAEAQAAVERYREASRRALLRKLQDLPGHALVETALLVLERLGMSQIRAVRRPAAPGGESHFSAVHRSGFGEIRTAVVIRRDGREIGRERVADLRGSLHHYGPAAAGWLITTGQVLSGAREESATQNAIAPIAVCDGIGFAKLCEENDIGVLKARMPIALPDVDWLESLKGS